MAVAVQEDVRSKLIEVTGEAMETFCDAISTMFEADISCTPKQQGQATIDGLKKLFRKVCAVHAVKAEGNLEGTFHLVFDQGGLFTLGGVVVMLPEARILEETRRGTDKDAMAMSDAVGEVGNLLVGAWDRVFRKDWAGHKHFVKGNTFIGVPWEKPQDSIGLPEGEDVEFALYEMTCSPYPPFSCAVLFPKKLLTAKSESKSSEVEEEPADQAVQEPSQAEASAQDSPDEVAQPQPDKPKVEDKGKPAVDGEAEPKPQPTAEDQPQPNSKPEAHSVEISPDTLLIGGAGTDIWGNADQFRFVYKQLKGNGSIVARVDSVANTHVWAKAGVMIRETLDAGSTHAAVVVTPGSGVSFQRRVLTRDISTNSDVAGLVTPYWVKLTRMGNTFTAQRSADGITWIDFPVTPALSITMAHDVYMGLAVTSHTADVVCEAKFSNVSTTGGVSEQWQVVDVGMAQPGGNAPETFYATLQDSAGKRVSDPGRMASATNKEKPAVQAEVQPPAQDRPQPPSSRTQAVQPAVVSPSESAGPTVPPRVTPGDSGVTSLLNLPVQQMMSTEVVWASPDDSVLDVLQWMQQHDAGYALVGRNGALEGIVSKSNILGGVSPYLRPVFSNWRRPEDDATLTIKIKWLMSRPVQTLSVEATLGQAIERMQQFGGRCLPVMGPAGKVLGIVTVFDVFQVLNPNRLRGRTPQAPCLMA